MLGRYNDTYDVTATDFAPFVGTTGIRHQETNRVGLAEAKLVVPLKIICQKAILTKGFLFSGLVIICAK